MHHNRLLHHFLVNYSVFLHYMVAPTSNRRLLNKFKKDDDKLHNLFGGLDGFCELHLTLAPAP